MIYNHLASVSIGLPLGRRRKNAAQPAFGSASPAHLPPRNSQTFLRQKRKRNMMTHRLRGRAMMSSESFFFLLHPMGLGSTFWAREGGPPGSPSLPIFLLLPKVHQFRSNSSLDMPQSRNTMAPLPSKDFKVGF